MSVGIDLHSGAALLKILQFSDQSEINQPSALRSQPDDTGLAMIPAKGMGPKIEQAGWSKEGQGFLDRHRDTIAMTQQQEECTKKREYRA